MIARLCSNCALLVILFLGPFLLILILALRLGFHLHLLQGDIGCAKGTPEKTDTQPAETSRTFSSPKSRWLWLGKPLSGCQPLPESLALPAVSPAWPQALPPPAAIPRLSFQHTGASNDTSAPFRSQQGKGCGLHFAQWL